LYRRYQHQLVTRVREALHRKYSLDVPQIVVEQPPRVELGEYALPLCFELARSLRKPPRKIAEEIVAAVGEVPGFEKLEVAGAGYINARLNRAQAAASLLQGSDLAHKDTSGGRTGRKILVEHSSINPNKAAHIGHLRNAILGDTFVRLLRSTGRRVDVQNYIDNTGVQVADVVVGFLYVEQTLASEIAALAASSARFDYVCWEVYARASRWYEEEKQNVQKRLETLHAIETGDNEVAASADLIATTVLRRHLDTMERLDIRYDFLPRESEILHLHFWESAFQQLRDKGVVWKETSGPKAGCWVMRRPGAAALRAKAAREGDPEFNAGSGTAENGEEGDDTKVIVRSNGTVVYEGKDIAYHLWKFGLLGRDFSYRRFYEYPDGQECWISTMPEQEEAGHPHFGGVGEIYNVIDARQAEAQGAVIDALRGLGYEQAAENYHHFSYEMVALTPRCAAELGYSLSEEEWGRSFIEVSGRKGFGVKADDLMDRLIASAAQEVDSRHAELSAPERLEIAEQIAMGALRYFMLKFTKPTVIAFDFKEALSFEGETGPYAQYAVVRASNIFRKAGVDPADILSAFALQASGSGQPAETLGRFLSGEDGSEIWELWLAASKTAYVVEQCIATTEPAYIAKHAFQLAQLFNNFYHRHHILTETDEQRKQFLLATVGIVRRELIGALQLMGITVPPVM
jgi:arginyl-tRNA synthetase